MGQREIIAWLESHPGWHSSKEILQGLMENGLAPSITTVRNGCRVAASWKDIRRSQCGQAYLWAAK
mgnify:CR=1 FL=1